MIPRKRDDWEHGPPYYRRKHGIIMVVVSLMGLVGVLTSQSWMVVGLNRQWWYIVVALAWLMLTVVVIAISLNRVRRRLRREFEAAGGRLCTHCAYSLKDLPRHGSCPECGQEYDAEFDAKTWWGAGFEVQAHTPPQRPNDEIGD